MSIPHPWTTLGLVLALSGAVACGAHRELARVQQLSTDDPLARARAAVAVAVARPGHGGAERLALGEVQALVDHAARPLDPEASWGELTGRVAAVDAALAVVERARRVGVPGEATDALAEARQRAVSALVAANLAAAAEAVGEGSYAVAVVRLEQSDGLLARHPETLAALVGARRAWAEVDLEAGRPRDAAERLARSASLSAEEGADRVRAAELFAALGRSALARGACRAASRDLQRATDLGGQVGEALDLARACARTPVSLSVDVPPGLPSLEARILERLQEVASPHLVLVAPDAAGAPRQLPSGPDGPGRLEGPYEVQLAVGLPAFRTQPPISSTRTVTQRTSANCRDPYGTLWPAPCDVDLRITYEEVREYVDGQLGGVLRVVSQGRPPQDLARFPVRVTAQDAASWRGEVLSVVAVQSFGVSTGSIPWRPRTSAFMRAVEPRAQARERLLDQLSVNLADHVARELVTLVDLELSVPDRLESAAPLPQDPP